MKKHCMLDMETMGLYDNAAVVQIGACYFDLATGVISKKWEGTIDLNESQEMGFYVEAETALWWMKQDRASIDAVFGPPTSPVKEVIAAATDFLKEADVIWMYGNKDSSWLINHQRELGQEVTPHWKFADMTVLWKSGLRVKAPASPEARGTSHNALSDCIYQVSMLTNTINNK